MKVVSSQWSVVSKSVFGFALCAVLFAPSLPVEAQQPTKIPRVAYLAATPASAQAGRLEALRQGLRDLGYVEGKSILIEDRYAEGNLDRLPALAAELVRLNVDMIVTAGPPVTRAVKKATATIPIVMAQDGDPVKNGFVVSLSRPGGNITGMSQLAPEISGKQLELLKEIVPRLSRVAVLGTSTRPGNAQALEEIELAARTFGVRLLYLDVLGPEDIKTRFREASKGRADGVIVLQGPIFTSRRTQITDLAAKSRLPAIYPQSEYMKAGGLMYYGANTHDLFRRAAYYVDKILKGAKPGELPIEQPRKFEFIINLRTAKQIGLTIPPEVLARADKVLK